MKLDMIHETKKLLDKHGPDLACLGALVSLGAALYSAFKASEKVVEAKKAYEEEVTDSEQENAPESPEMPVEPNTKKLRKARIARDIDYIFAYKWALLFGTGSAFLMILSRKLSGAQIAGLTAALCMSEDKLKKLSNKVKDVIGEDELNKLKAEIRQERAEETIKPDDAPFDPAKACNEANMTVDKLIYDDMTGTMFEIEPCFVKDWEAAAREEFNRHGRLDFNKFRSIGGLEDCKLGKYSEWNQANPFEGFTIVPMKWHDMWIGSIVYANDPVDTRL